MAQVLDPQELPYLRVGPEWTELEVVRGPEVIYTRKGYAPVIVVMRGAVAHVVYVSASSIAEPLEQIRKSRGGSLVGVKIRVRKHGTEQFSPYEVEVHPTGKP
jgi:hypothetical protein